VSSARSRLLQGRKKDKKKKEKKLKEKKRSFLEREREREREREYLNALDTGAPPWGLRRFFVFQIIC
jgi:hypothetical protein